MTEMHRPTEKSASSSIERGEFDAVLPIWSRELWPGRQSPIEPTSAMKFGGGYDMQLMQAAPTFWLARENSHDRADAGPIAGVLSGHFGGVVDNAGAIVRSYRTRGLWVAPAHRGQGVAKRLMLAAFAQAQAEDCPLVWTFPRQSSMPFYSALGFRVYGDWLGADDPFAGEFAPNAFAAAAVPEQLHSLV